MSSNVFGNVPCSVKDCKNNAVRSFGGAELCAHYWESYHLQQRALNNFDHPAHYGGDVPHEAIKCITAWQLNFALGNCAKYICRAGRKLGVDALEDLEDALEDLEKARWYLDWEIEQRKEARDGASK